MSFAHEVPPGILATILTVIDRYRPELREELLGDTVPSYAFLEVLRDLIIDELQNHFLDNWKPMDNLIEYERAIHYIMDTYLKPSRASGQIGGTSPLHDPDVPKA